MRGLEITLLLICIILALPLVSIALPAYNGGNGVPTGAQDTTGLNAFNWSKAEALKPNQTSPNVIDQGRYFFAMAEMAIFGIGTILFSALWTAPALISIFGIPPLLAGILLSLFAIVLIIAWLQIIKGDDWSGRR
jgi:hypothetical protein